jgi:diacylglycerol kinase family enzyme
MNKFEQFISTCYLSNHVFLNRPKTKSWNAQDVSVSMSERTALEMDGEVRMVKDVKISLIKGGLNVCQ